MSSNCLPHHLRRVSEKAAEEARIARDEEFHRRDEEFHRSTELYLEQQRVRVMASNDL